MFLYSKTFKGFWPYLETIYGFGLNKSMEAETACHTHFSHWLDYLDLKGLFCTWLFFNDFLILWFEMENKYWNVYIIIIINILSHFACAKWEFVLDFEKQGGSRLRIISKCINTSWDIWPGKIACDVTFSYLFKGM
jgi:hypothetical protein